MDGFATVMKWHDWWWLWALEHCMAGYGFSHTLHNIVVKLMTLSPSLSPHTHTCTMGQYELGLAPCRYINLTWNISWAFLLYMITLVHEQRLW